MKKLIIIILFTNLLFSQNILFVIKDSKTLNCEDITKIEYYKTHDKKHAVYIKYNKNGLKKISDLLKNSIGEKIGMIIGDRVLYFGTTVRENIAKTDLEISLIVKNKAISKLLIDSLTCNKK